MSRERAELSKKNPYHIPRYRYYELKYFCRQYDDWKKALTLIDGWQTSPNDISGIIKGCPPESPTERIALSRVFYSSCIDIVDRCINYEKSYYLCCCMPDDARGLCGSVWLWQL